MLPWYVWVLFALQIALFAMIIKPKPKSKEAEDTPQHHEDKIIQLYDQIEEMLDSFETYVGEMHTGLEEKRQELIELNRQAQVVYMQALAAAKPIHEVAVEVVEEPPPAAAPKEPKKSKAKPAKEPSSRLTDKDKEALGRFATKPQKVRYLMSRGMSLDEVARELDIGRGEVILIADLDR